MFLIVVEARRSKVKVLGVSALTVALCCYVLPLWRLEGREKARGSSVLRVLSAWENP